MGSLSSAGGGVQLPAAEVERCYVEAGLSRSLELPGDVARYINQKAERFAGAMRRLHGATVRSPFAKDQPQRTPEWPVTPSRTTPQELAVASEVLAEHTDFRRN